MPRPAHPNPDLHLLPPDPLHLYIHVPFCARRCSYCDFAIAVRRDVPVRAYLDAVGAEWRSRSATEPWAGGGPLATVYFGGGTPSALPAEAIGELLHEVAASRGLAPGAEVTLEANPDDVTPEAARGWRRAGVTRVSLGVQSFDDGVLRWMHRTHTAGQVPRAVAALREAGIEQLSLDLIYGLPAALGRDWSSDLDAAMALEPEHLSCYALTVEPATPLARWVARGQVAPAPDGVHAEEFGLLHVRATAGGFEHYEVSNLARPGKRAVHNSAYWRRARYLGLGPSAHSGAGAMRCWNTSAWEAYRRQVGAGDSPEAGSEWLPAEAVALEDLYLGLRTAEGVRRDGLPAEVIPRWVAAGWATTGPERVALTPAGWFRLDALVVEAAGTNRSRPLAPAGLDS